MNYESAHPMHLLLQNSSLNAGITWPELLAQFHTESFFTGNREDSRFFLPDSRILDKWDYIRGECVSGVSIKKSILPYGKSSSERIICGHYVICNHRRKEGREGCGKSFSVYLAKTLKHLNICTKSLWMFLQNIADGKGAITAFRNVLSSSFCDRTIHRLKAGFHNIQSKIRTRLLSICSALEYSTSNHLMQTITHLKVAFTDTDDPIAEFQMRFNEGFF